MIIFILQQKRANQLPNFDNAIILNPNDNDSYSSRVNTKALIGQTQSACLYQHKEEQFGKKEVYSKIMHYCN